jgi:hypothetical protein
LMSKVEEAAARYAAGLPMDPDPGLRKLSSWMRSVGVIF